MMIYEWLMFTEITTWYIKRNFMLRLSMFSILTVYFWVIVDRFFAAHNNEGIEGSSNSNGGQHTGTSSGSGGASSHSSHPPGTPQAPSSSKPHTPSQQQT